MSNPLRDYQTQAVVNGFHVLSAFGGFYVQHDPGMGKTLTTIALARLLNVKRVLVLCPPVALGVWPREMAKWWPRSPVELRCAPYDSLYDPMPAKGKRRTVGRSRVAELSDWEPELLVLDEAQYAKDVNAKRTLAVFQISRYSVYKLALSGTPAHNYLDLYSQYKILLGDQEPLFNRTFTEYKQLIYHCHPTMGYPSKNKDGSLRMKPGARDALVQATAPYTHVATADQMELPEPVFSEVPFTLNTVESVAYASMEQTLRADLPDGSETEAEIVLTKLLRLTQIAAGHTTNTTGNTVYLGNSRVQATMGLLDDRPGQKVVVACRFREDIAQLVKALNERGRPLAIIDGNTPAGFRTKYEEWFQSEGSPRNAVILLQYQAGGTAITLHAARTLVLHTLDLSVIRYRQMIGRIWRLGQKGLCEVLVPVAEQTQDETALAGLRAGDENRLARLLLNKLRGM